MAKPFRIQDLAPEHLAGGALAQILPAVVVPEKAWARHVAKLERGAGKALRRGLAAALGHDVPEEIAEWVELEGKRGIPETHDSGWYLGLDVAVPEGGAKGAQRALQKQAILLLAGLAPFGRDASGDQAWASLRPHPLGVAEVLLFNHEVGEVEGVEGASIADFVVEKWVCGDDPEDEYASPGWIGRAHGKVQKAQKAFRAQAKKALAKREKHLAPQALWERTHWLYGLLDGEPAFRFPEKLAKAPPLSAFAKEKAKLATEPELALYWMLAHLFLGNDDALGEAVAAAKKTKGSVVKELAAGFEAFLAGKRKSPLDFLKPEALAAARELVAKNALPEQLEKKRAGAAQGAAKVDTDAVRAQDAALQALAKSDEKKASLVKDYLRERTQEAYNHWPYKGTIPDWLVGAAAAAFRAGLAVDLGHPKAYAGVTRAVAGRADQPEARAALIAALGTLAPADDRLEHVLEALLRRQEPEARAALRAAAWRWLDEAAKIDKVLAKRQERFSLDDVFAKDDLLQPAVHAVLAACDEEAERLALAISEKQLSFRVLKRTAGLVFRVYGARKRSDRLERMQRFLSLLDEVPGSTDPEEKGVRLDTTASVAMAEASRAIARLDPKDAKKRFAAMLARRRSGPEREAGVAACLLPGLLELDPKDATALRWLERVLGARAAPPWLYGALVAAPAAGRRVAPWVLPHAYTSRINSMHGEFEAMEAVARETLEALGTPAPPFDEEDEYVRDVPVGELGAALLTWARYDKGAVLKRIEEAKAEAQAAKAVGAFLEDRLRFSRWEPLSHFTSDELQKAVGLLRKAGKDGARELERLGKLPELGAWAKELLAGEA
jgi:hypothetical protein